MLRDRRIIREGLDFAVGGGFGGGRASDAMAWVQWCRLTVGGAFLPGDLTMPLAVSFRS